MNTKTEEMLLFSYRSAARQLPPLFLCLVLIALAASSNVMLFFVQAKEVRLDCGDHIDGKATNVSGHVVVLDTNRKNRTRALDEGCDFTMVDADPSEIILLGDHFARHLNFTRVRTGTLFLRGTLNASRQEPQILPRVVIDQVVIDNLRASERPVIGLNMGPDPTHNAVQQLGLLSITNSRFSHHVYYPGTDNLVGPTSVHGVRFVALYIRQLDVVQRLVVRNISITADCLPLQLDDFNSQRASAPGVFLGGGGGGGMSVLFQNNTVKLRTNPRVNKEVASGGWVLLFSKMYNITSFIFEHNRVDTFEQYQARDCEPIAVLHITGLPSLFDEASPRTSPTLVSISHNHVLSVRELSPQSKPFWRQTPNRYHSSKALRIQDINYVGNVTIAGNNVTDLGEQSATGVIVLELHSIGFVHVRGNRIHVHCDTTETFVATGLLVGSEDDMIIQDVGEIRIEANDITAIVDRAAAMAVNAALIYEPSNLIVKAFSILLQNHFVHIPRGITIANNTAHTVLRCTDMSFSIADAVFFLATAVLTNVSHISVTRNKLSIDGYGTSVAIFSNGATSRAMDLLEFSYNNVSVKFVSLVLKLLTDPRYAAMAGFWPVSAKQPGVSIFVMTGIGASNIVVRSNVVDMTAQPTGTRYANFAALYLSAAAPGPATTPTRSVVVEGTIVNVTQPAPTDLAMRSRLQTLSIDVNDLFSRVDFVLLGPTAPVGVELGSVVMRNNTFVAASAMVFFLTIETTYFARQSATILVSGNNITVTAVSTQTAARFLDLVRKQSPLLGVVPQSSSLKPGEIPEWATLSSLVNVRLPDEPDVLNRFQSATVQIIDNNFTVLPLARDDAKETKTSPLTTLCSLFNVSLQQATIGKTYTTMAPLATTNPAPGGSTLRVEARGNTAVLDACLESTLVGSTGNRFQIEATVLDNDVSLNSPTPSSSSTQRDAGRSASLVVFSPDLSAGNQAQQIKSVGIVVGNRLNCGRIGPGGGGVGGGTRCVLASFDASSSEVDLTLQSNVISAAVSSSAITRRAAGDLMGRALVDVGALPSSVYLNASAGRDGTCNSIISSEYDRAADDSEQPRVIVVNASFALLSSGLPPGLPFEAHGCNNSWPATKTMTRSIVEEPPTPPPPAVSQQFIVGGNAAQGVAAASVAVSAAVVPSLSFSVARQQAMLDFVQAVKSGDCSGIASPDDVPLASSPTQMVIGSGDARGYVGGTVGNVVLLVGVVLLAQLLGTLFMRRVGSSSWDRPYAVFARCHVALALYVLTSLLFAPTLTYALVAAAIPSETVALKVLAVIFGGLLFPAAALCYAVWSIFVRERKHDKYRVVHLTKTELEKRSTIRRWVGFWLDGPGEWTVAAKCRDERVHLDFDAANPILDGYTPRAPWFGLAEYAVQVGLALAAFLAQVVAAKVSCLTQCVVLLVTLGAHLFLCVWLRPFQELLNRIFMPLSSAVEMAVILIAYLQKDDAPAWIESLALAVVSFQSAMAGIVVLASLGPLMKPIMRAWQRLRSAGKRQGASAARRGAGSAGGRRTTDDRRGQSGGGRNTKFGLNLQELLADSDNDEDQGDEVELTRRPASSSAAASSSSSSLRQRRDITQLPSRQHSSSPPRSSRPSAAPAASSSFSSSSYATRSRPASSSSDHQHQHRPASTSNSSSSSPRHGSATPRAYSPPSSSSPLQRRQHDNINNNSGGSGKDAAYASSRRPSQRHDEQRREEYFTPRTSSSSRAGGGNGARGNRSGASARDDGDDAGAYVPPRREHDGDGRAVNSSAARSSSSRRGNEQSHVRQR